MNHMFAGYGLVLTLLFCSAMNADAQLFRRNVTNVRVNVAAPAAVTTSVGVGHGVTSVGLVSGPAYVNSQVLIQGGRRGVLNQVNSFGYQNNTAANIRYLSQGVQYLAQPPIVAAPLIQRQTLVQGACAPAVPVPTQGAIAQPEVQYQTQVQPQMLVQPQMIQPQYQTQVQPQLLVQPQYQTQYQTQYQVQPQLLVQPQYQTQLLAQPQCLTQPQLLAQPRYLAPAVPLQYQARYNALLFNQRVSASYGHRTVVRTRTVHRRF